MKRSQLKMSSSASSARSQRLKHVYFLASAFNNHGISPTTMHFSIICRKWEQMKIYWQKLWNTWLNRGFFYAPSPKKVFFKMSVYSGLLTCCHGQGLALTSLFIYLFFDAQNAITFNHFLSLIGINRTVQRNNNDNKTAGRGGVPSHFQRDNIQICFTCLETLAGVIQPLSSTQTAWGWKYCTFHILWGRKPRTTYF